MEKFLINDKKSQVLQVLTEIPKKILALHGRENIAELVLHDLSHENCFDLKKAAYFVDNPDFNCLKGVAGISTKEVPKDLWQDVWAHNEKFSTYMRNAVFNKKVREFSQCSLRAGKGLNDQEIQLLSNNLGIENPRYFSLDLKHGNHGLFVFEKNSDEHKHLDEHISHGASLLGFCPIF
jgi:hypothetical protein